MQTNEIVDNILAQINETASSFAKSIGITPTQVYDLKSGKIHKISQTIARKIIDVYPQFNITWLLTGEGEMLATSEKGSNGVQEVSNGVAKDGKTHAIRYYPNSDGSMGAVQFLDNPNEDYIELVIPGYSDCQYAINAFGDSMSPLINSGQIIILSEWTERFIAWGNIYLIITRSGYRTIKKVYPGKDNGTTSVICKSENAADYPPFEILQEDICKIYHVKGWINRNVI